MANFLLSSEPKGYQKRRGEKGEWVKENRAGVNQIYGKEAPDLLYNTLVGPEILHFTFLLFQDINRR